jgi:hypothetical protein
MKERDKKMRGQGWCEDSTERPERKEREREGEESERKGREREKKVKERGEIGRRK